VPVGIARAKQGLLKKPFKALKMYLGVLVLFSGYVIDAEVGGPLALRNQGNVSQRLSPDDYKAKSQVEAFTTYERTSGRGASRQGGAMRPRVGDLVTKRWPDAAQRQNRF
jgi:hypothetical protein